MQTYPLAINIISVCWTLFGVIWLLAAFATKKSVYRESRAQRLRYTIPILLGGFLLAKGHRLSDPLNYRVIPHVEALAWTGVVLCIAGLLFCIWARFTLGRNWSGVDSHVLRGIIGGKVDIPPNWGLEYDQHTCQIQQAICRRLNGSTVPFSDLTIQRFNVREALDVTPALLSFFYFLIRNSSLAPAALRYGRCSIKCSHRGKAVEHS